MFPLGLIKNQVLSENDSNTQINVFNTLRIDYKLEVFDAIFECFITILGFGSILSYICIICCIIQSPCLFSILKVIRFTKVNTVLRA